MNQTDKESSLYSESELDLKEIFQVIWHGKLLIASITTLFSIVAIIYSLSLPNIFISKALLINSETNNSISSTLSNYSGLAAFAGVNLPSQGTKNNGAQAIEKLLSLSFFESNILPNISLAELMAVKSWDQENNTLIFNEAIYNLKTNAWVQNESDLQKFVPSSQESFKKFIKHVSIIKNDYSGFVDLEIRHQSPLIAKEWAELLVNQINLSFRAADKKQAEKALNYLNSEIAKTNLTEIKQVLAQLLQQEIQKLTLIEANDAYVFDYIDPPAVMEKKAEPNRTLICILGAFLGIVIGTLLVLIRYYFYSKNEINTAHVQS
jgi:capsular polysaccharide biosynthesis protein